MACTSFGAWLYDDPSFALASVTVRQQGAEPGVGDSLELIFVGCNLNDYDLTGETVTTRLAVAGHTVVDGARPNPVFFGTRDTSEFSVTLPMQETGFAADNSAVPFELLMRSALHTPVGIRNVVFRVRGRVQRAGDKLTWVGGEATRRCRPGLTVLPASFDPRPAIAPPRQDPPPQIPQPRNGPIQRFGPGERPPHYALPFFDFWLRK